MFPFLSTRTHSKDQVAVRAVVCLFALLFLLISVLSALPSFGTLTDYFTESGLAGYAQSTERDASEHEGALSQFTDRPRDQTSPADEASAPVSEPSEKAAQSAV